MDTSSADNTKAAQILNLLRRAIAADAQVTRSEVIAAVGCSESWFFSVLSTPAGQLVVNGLRPEDRVYTAETLRSANTWGSAGLAADLDALEAADTAGLAQGSGTAPVRRRNPWLSAVSRPARRDHRGKAVNPSSPPDWQEESVRSVCLGVRAAVKCALAGKSTLLLIRVPDVIGCVDEFWPEDLVEFVGDATSFSELVAQTIADQDPDGDVDDLDLTVSTRYDPVSDRTYDVVVVAGSNPTPLPRDLSHKFDWKLGKKLRGDVEAAEQAISDAHFLEAQIRWGAKAAVIKAKTPDQGPWASCPTDLARYERRMAGIASREAAAAPAGTWDALKAQMAANRADSKANRAERRVDRIHTNALADAITGLEILGYTQLIPALEAMQAATDHGGVPTYDEYLEMRAALTPAEDFLYGQMLENFSESPFKLFSIVKRLARASKA